MENLEEVVHAENGWTTSRTGVDAANRTCSTWRKTNACRRNESVQWLTPTGDKPKSNHGS